MKNRKMIKTESGKSKTRLFAVLGLCATFACSLGAGAAALPAVAMNTSGAATVAELWGNGQFNKSAVSDLLSKTTGKSTYNEALTYLNSQTNSAITASALYSRNGNKDLLVDFGGEKWTVTYVSKDNSGNMIATLWYAGEEINSAYSNGWVSGSEQGGYSNYTKHSNHYGGSYLRAVVLGNGGSYYSALGTISSDSGVTTQTATAEEAKSSKFYGYAQGEFSNYLVAPKNVSWQQSQMEYPLSWTQYRLQNESLQKETTSWYNENITNSQNDPLYFQWGSDNVWLPSISEAGNGDSYKGIWQTTTNQRKSASSETFSWVRSSQGTNADNARVISSNGSSSSKLSNTRNGVRPAIHLNLNAAYASANSIGELYNKADSTIDGEVLTRLYAAVTGKSGATYNDLKSSLKANGGALSSADIRTASADTLVAFGGELWDLTYVSKDENGNLIATLWYSGAETTSEFSNGWASTTERGAVEGYTKFSNIYGGSPLRAIALGNGGQYYTAQGASVKLNSDVSTKFATAAEVQASKYYNFAQGYLSKYLVAPNKVEWQKVQYSRQYSAHRNLNENLVYVSENWFSQNVEKGQTASLYYQWGNDKIWLPSMSETGTGATFTGIWNTSTEQRSSTEEYSWLRTGVFDYIRNSFVLNSSGAYSGSVTSNINGVRPAIHFNLTLAANQVEEPEADLAELWNDAVQQSIDTNAQVTFKLPCDWFAKKDSDFVTSFGTGIGFDKGRLYVPSNANIKLDLNGHTIDRALSSAIDDGNVIIVGDPDGIASGGVFELCDSSINQAGRITGGFALNGSAIFANNAKITILSGNIIGNNTENGGAVRVNNCITIISGGKISENTSRFAGGVYAVNGTLSITGGEISHNVAEYGGGLYIRDSIVANISGGEISYNVAEYGGGICLSAAAQTDKGVVNLSGGKIIYNHASNAGGGINFNQAGTDNEFNMTGGVVSHNSAKTAAGLRFYADGSSSHVINIMGGEISYNEATSGDSGGLYAGTLSTLAATELRITFNFGGSAVLKNNKTSNNSGGIRLVRAVAEISGGIITQNEAVGYGGGVTAIYDTKLTVSGGEISHNKAGTYGGGISLAVSADLTISGGEIKQNIAGTLGGGLYLNASSLTMNDVTIKDNTASESGGGIYILNAANTVTLKNNKILNNSAVTYGGGVYVSGGTVILDENAINDNTTGTCSGALHVTVNTNVTINSGVMRGNSTTNVNSGGGAIYLNGSSAVLTINGGIITENWSYGFCGGVRYLSGTLNISGGIIADNYAYGVMTDTGSPQRLESNVTFNNNNKINITGDLSKTATYIGVNMSTAGTSNNEIFTSGYTSAGNTNAPASYFFADVVATTLYEITLNNGEAQIVAKTHTMSTLIWQYSTDNVNWLNMDTPYFAVTFGGTYYYRAMNGNAQVTSGSFNTVGQHAVTLNNTDNKYTNPTVLFEILPVEITWKYSTDGGSTWLDFDETSIDYTGETYIIGAFDNNGNPVTLSTKPSGVIKAANKYEFAVNNASGSYSNESFTFTIRVRHITVEWQYTGAASGSVWNYDGLAHSPVAVLLGISNEQAGNMPLGYAYEVRGSAAGTSAPKDAGYYTVTVTLLNQSGSAPLNDPNITLSNVTATFTIKPKTITISWLDEDGKAVDEAKYEFNGKGREVTAKLNGVLPADSVAPVISYFDGSKQLTSAPVNKGVYTAKAALPANCYNYLLDFEYSCQINIGTVEISVSWTGNSANKGAFEWEFYGYHTNMGVLRAPVPALDNPVAGQSVTHSVEYAAVASDGTIGAYSSTVPVNAGKYVARVKVTDKEGNYTLKGETREFEITKLGVELVWKDGATVLTPDEDGFVKWEYDGNAHDVTPSIDSVPVYKDGTVGAILTAVRTDTNGALTDVGTAIATGALDPDDAFNANFYIKGSATCNYKVYKKVLSSAVWTDKNGDSYSTGDKPRYDHGTITGASGPAFTVTAQGAGSAVLNLGTVTYSATFAGEWSVDEVNGYTATAKLSASDYKNYEFDEGKDSTTLTFLIRSVSGSKENITVTWVVFTGANTYDKISSGYAFTYNGAQQFPRALYVKNDGTYEELALSANGKGIDAGNYTVRLLPSSKYNIADSDFTFDYVIKPVDITITWQDGANNSAQTFSYIYNGGVQKPHAVVSGNGSLACPVTVEDSVNAGSYTAVAKVSKNFNIVSGETQKYEITKLQLNSTLINWDYATDNALTNSQNVKYWVYDGKAHAPNAYILLTTLNNLRIDLVVTGATSAIGTHTVYAMLDSENPAHANFDISGAAQSTFEIVRVPVTTVYWEDGAGNTSQNGATLLSFTYNGSMQAPTAYFMNGTTKVPLNVAGGMVDAGKYTAYITDNFDYGTTVPPQCNFEIKPVEVTIVWSDTTATYNGMIQYPTATLEDGAGNPFAGVGGNPLVLNTDYTVTGFDGAGAYTAEIKFLNKNYTFAGMTGKTSFTVESADITSIVQPTDWSATGKTPDATSGLYEWSYDTQKHAPELSLTYRLDGDLVTFTFAYTGVTSTVGKHTVTALVTKAMWRGKDISANLKFSAEIDYVIKPFEITLTWDFAGEGATEDTVANVWYWNYDGTEHAPAVSYTDWDGTKQTLTVFGGATNARATAYTARVDAPANCVFAQTETGTRTFEIRKGSIAVVWVFSGNDGINGSAPYWTYDGKPHGVTAYIADASGNATSAKLNEVTYINAGSYVATAAQSDENYTITSGATFSFTIEEKEVYVKWLGKEGSTTDFAWEYDGKAHKPTAVLCDASGALILGADGKRIEVSVTGEMTDAGKTHTAQAVDTFANYKFHASATVTQTYEIKPQSVSNLGFKWTADGAVKSNDGKYDVYTYVYSGKSISPKPDTSNNLAFNTVINVYNKNGTLGAVVQSIEEVGEYLVTITPVNGNYSVPAGLQSVRVSVTAFKAEVVWSTDKLTYNGAAQAPTAYYIDAQGQQIPLDVTGAMTDAGKNYSATAKFRGTAPDNYVLDKATTKFEIAQLEIPVSWDFTGATLNSSTNNYEWNYDGANHRPAQTVDTSVILTADKNSVTFGFEITKTGATGKLTTVKDAGEYKIALVLNGTASANYKFASSEQTFKILKQKLEVTAQDETVTYGQNAPAYSAVFVGWVGSEQTTEEAKLLAVQASWLKCSYTNRSVPGTYTIGLVQSVLDGLLPNYDVLIKNGTLTVKPADRTVIWKGDLSDLGAYYDGTEYKPSAYYVDGGNNIPLDIVYASYNQATGEYTEINDPTYLAVDAGTYYVIAKSSGAAVNLANDRIDYKIYEREITVIIENKLSVYGDAYKTLTYRFGTDGLQPLPADDLKITLNCDVLDSSKYVNGFMNAGTYDVTGTWDSAAFDKNYDLTFVNEDGSDSKGVYTISKAQIKVTKANEAFSDEEFTSIRELAGDGKATYIKLGDTFKDDNGLTQYKFIQYNGYQNATQVTVHYSRKYNIGDIDTGLQPVPFTPEDLVNNNYQTSQFDGMWNKGCYAYNYYIEIPNHETLYGTWTVLMLPESQVVRVEFVKDYEIEYGKPVPADLAKELLEGGYININISNDRFIQNATATVSDGRGGHVGSTTDAGRYTIEIQITNTDANTQLLVTYHNDFGAEDTNVGRYRIKPRKLTVDWGTLEFDHDGTLKLPTPNVYGFVTADTLVLENIKTRADNVSYEYTAYLVNDNGVDVTIIVAARGDFMTVGGHTLLVTVENGNYEIELLNASATVSIKGDNVTVQDGLPDWLMWVIIAAAVLVAILIIVIIVVVKRKKAIAEDDDGFYDDIPTEE